MDDMYVPKAFRKNIETEKREAPVNPRNIKNTRNKRKKKKRKKTKLKKIILTIVLILIIGAAVSLGIASHRWKTLAKEMLANENSIVIDVDGNEIAKLGCEKNKEYIPMYNIPDNLKNAYVAIEDERFYDHGGIDLKRTGGAIFSYIVHFGKSSYGGSTITQQLVKNLTGDSTDNITRKIKEWWEACQLETCSSKDEILEAYLNIIYVGPNMYGIETGAKYYFNKSAKDLSLEECAFLAGINNSPNSYNPFSTDNNNSEKIAKRTKTVLSKMKELNYIDENSYNTAVSSVDAGLHFTKGNIQTKEALYSYHTDSLILEITEDISKKYNISKTFATNYINMAGLTIHSNQDSDVQSKTENEFAKTKYQLPSQTGKNPSQAAMVIIDHKTGYIVGCTGGLGKKTEVRSLNRATQSIRQTGSSIKPLAVLMPGIDKKIITASSICDDTERDFAEGYHPTDLNHALGQVTVRRAVESSQNIPFVEIMDKIKPKNSIKYLEKMGITTLTKEDETLVLALGGLQKGISPLEMAGAYSTIANDGEYIEPTFYSHIDNKAGKTIVKTKQERKRVISKESAYILKEILKQPVEGTYGTATYCKISGVDVAAKTGTTDNDFDRYDESETIHYNNRNPAGLLWANVMSRIHAGLNSASFSKPNSVQTANICAKTGKKATTGCPETYTEYFLWGTVPGLCNEHSGSELKTDTNSNTQNKTHEVVQDITEDIDAVDPQQVPVTDNTTKTNTTTTNTTNVTKPSSNTTKNHSSSNSTVSNTTTNTNTNRANTNLTNVTNNANVTNFNRIENTTNTNANNTEN